MRLGPEDRIVGMVVGRRDGMLLVCTVNGHGKRSPLHEYRLAKRGAQGVLAMKTTPATGPLIALMEVTDSDDLLIITFSGMVIRQSVSALRTLHRATQGVKLLNLKREDGAPDTISDIAKVVHEEAADGEGDEGEEEIGPEEQKELAL